MKLRAAFKKHTLAFRFEAGTSRGIMKTRDTWFLFLSEAGSGSILGIGEAAPIEGLSVEKTSGMDAKLQEVCQAINEGRADSPKQVASVVGLRNYPSIFFALETAFKDMQLGSQRMIFQNSFAWGKSSIPINGLIWMESIEHMQHQVQQRISEGYTCLKIKIGALDFESECALLKRIREMFPQNKITIKLDANGAFDSKEALPKLERLAAFDIHSIEQPVKSGRLMLMKELCNNSPVPIALDEELIGIFSHAGKANLLEQLKPSYIVLKPSLLGGFKASEEWIYLSEEMGIGWWLTSALESNIGLNAISQFAASHFLTNFQGLGTGKLYHNNISSPLCIEQGSISYNTSLSWDLSELNLKLIHFP